MKKVNIIKLVDLIIKIEAKHKRKLILERHRNSILLDAIANRSTLLVDIASMCDEYAKEISDEPEIQKMMSAELMEMTITNEYVQVDGDYLMHVAVDETG